MKKIIKRKSGFTLIEILLIVGFIGVASTGAYVTYSKSKISSAIDAEAKNIEVLHDGVVDYYLHDRTYINLNNTLVNDANITPTNMKGAAATDILHSFGSNIDIVSGMKNRPNDMFTITYNAVPAQYCSKFVSQVKNIFDEVVIAGTAVRTDGVDTNNLALLPALCNAAAGVNIAFSTINYNSVGVAAVDPVINSVRVINSTPFATETAITNNNYNVAYRARTWGTGSTTYMYDNPVSITVNGRVLGFNSDNPITFNASQRHVDIVFAAIDPWYKSQLAANGGNRPASFSDPMFRNNPSYGIYVAAMYNIAILSCQPRDVNLPSAYWGLISSLTTYIGTLNP